MRASGRLQHEDMPPEQFSGVVPYDGGETPETPEVPQTTPEGGQAENNSSGSDIRYFDNNGQRVWADMSTLQGIGVLPDGTYINTTGDAYADTLYEIIRAEAAGEISTEEARWRKTALARKIAENEVPKGGMKREKAFKRYLAVFSARTIDYYQIPDYTKQVDLYMRWAESVCIQMLQDDGLSADEESLQKNKLFAFLVMPGGPFDLKELPIFQAHSLFIYNGEIVSRDMFGNYLYGYLGKVLGYDDDTLQKMAGSVQKATGTSDENWEGTDGDDPRDRERIQQGIQWYIKTH